MILPTIHLNGTSRDALYAENLKAWQALQDARRAIGEAYPNARDYYPQGDEAFQIARSEWGVQAGRIDDAMEHFQALLLHLRGEG